MVGVVFNLFGVSGIRAVGFFIFVSALFLILKVVFFRGKLSFERR